MNNLSKKLTTAGLCAALLVTAGIASAQTVRHDRHEIAKTEAKLGRERAQYRRDISHGNVRAAAREERKIDRTESRLRKEKREIRHDRHGW